MTFHRVIAKGVCLEAIYSLRLPIGKIYKGKKWPGIVKQASLKSRQDLFKIDFTI